MFQITSGIHIHFGHHVRGHKGPCISVHGHTWKFEVTFGATELDNQGFVVDFDDVHDLVLTPCHTLLDHSFVIGEETWQENKDALAQLGTGLVDSRHITLGNRGERQSALAVPLHGARNEFPGDIKVAVFPSTPSSERMAEWMFGLAHETMASDRVKVINARIFETLHPVECYAEFQPSS